MYLLVRRHRARVLFDRFSEYIQEHAGVRTHLGKTRVWGSGLSACPPGFAELGEHVWRGDKDPVQQGLVALGSPFGHQEFIKSWSLFRYSKVEALTAQLSNFDDPQIRWCLLKYCVEPRINHLLRNVPPESIGALAEVHDTHMQECLLALFNSSPALAADITKRVASLPLRYGGCGLRSAVRTSPAAYWGAWADVLSFVQSRFPDLANDLRTHLQAEHTLVQCVVAVRSCQNLLQSEGAVLPTWAQLFAGARPQIEANEQEAGSWIHGWQAVAAMAREKAASEQLRRESSPPEQALLLSQTGRGAGDWLLAVPTSRPLTMDATTFLLAFRRRLFMPLPLGQTNCASCGHELDEFGHHVLACTRTGWLKRRSAIHEMTWVQIAGEALATVKYQPKMNSFGIPGVAPTDQRKLDLVIARLPIFGGKTVIGDCTLRSPLTGAGDTRPHASSEAGATFHGARVDKAAKYPELHRPQSRFAFLVLASEVGGHSSDECHALLKQLARARANLHQETVRQAAKAMYLRRWYSILSVGIQRAVAANLSGVDNTSLENFGVSVAFDELFHACANLSEVSRMPMH